jgi:hypothetical protein
MTKHILFFRRLVWLVLIIACFGRVDSQQGGKFVFAQLKYGGTWDTRSGAWNMLSDYLSMTTSIKMLPERRIIQLKDDKLYWSPFLVITGGSAFSDFREDEIKILRKYLLCGGIIFIEDSTGRKGFGFDRSIRNTLKLVLPEAPLERIQLNDAVFRSFYLLRAVPGRIMTNAFIEGCKLGDRYCVIYSQNDLLGAWEKDNLGNYLYPCSDQQRWEAKKLSINIIMYALTGTYKTDMIHVPFIENKLR